MKVLAFKAKISAKITLDIKSAEFSLLFIREFSYFFVYCGSNFEGKKDLIFCGYRANIPPTANSPSKFLVRGVFLRSHFIPQSFSEQTKTVEIRVPKSRRFPDESAENGAKNFLVAIWDHQAAGSIPVTRTR